ncbi:phage tail spike protein [Oceanobacillus sp. CF4.6]|uniref:phage tail spike protein n=1 Tax=Oceanobacillus sp. CF4.6 TaxID=3373080 RepID=UPI003EE62E1C
MIFITDKQTDKVLDFITFDKVIENSHKRSLIDYQETFDFRTFNNEKFSKFLTDRNHIIIPDENKGEYREFIINEDASRHNSNGVYREVYANAHFLTLSTAAVIRPQSFSDMSVRAVAKDLLNTTEFEVGLVESDMVISIEATDYTNPYAMLKEIAKKSNTELNFRVAIDNNGVAKRYVDFLERVGDWQGRTVEFGRDLLELERNVRTDEIVTALLVVGPKQENGQRLEVLIEDADALVRWGRDGQHIIKPFTPEGLPSQVGEQNLQYVTQQMQLLGREELDKRINAVVTYSGGIADLENVSGHENKVQRFGDTIRIKDSAFEPSLYMEARIFYQDRDIVQENIKDIELGDFQEFTEDEIKAQWLKLQPIIDERISDELLTTTYTKSEIDTKDTNTLDAAALDAKTKADAAQLAAEEYALAEANLAQTKAEAHADGIVTTEEQARIDADTAKLAEAKQHAETKASEAEAAATAYTDSQLTNYVDAITYDSDVANIQAQIDNQIQSHFYDHEPTLNNMPAMEWTTTDEQNRHIGDLFYDSSSGYSYRFMLDGTVYKWTLVRDEGIAKALQDAANAQDTADGKRRVFVDTPTTPYDTGDLWDNNGAVYRSSVTKSSSATFSSADWVKIGDVTSENTANDVVYVDGRPAVDIEDKAGAQDKVDAIEIGVRNLVNPNEIMYRYDGTDVIVEGYKITALVDSTELGGYVIKVSPNTEYILSYISDSDKGIRYYEHPYKPAFFADGYTFAKVNHKSGETFITGADTEFLYLAVYPSDYTTFPRVYNWIKLEKGNKATDWTPAPEDVDQAISNAQATADGKNTVFYSATQPSTSGKKTNDVWFDTDDDNRIYRFDGSSWVAAQFGTNAIANLAITNALIADGTIQNAKIGNLDAGKITTGVLNAARVTIGSGTSFDANYDPTTKETPTGSQSKADGAESSAKAHADGAASTAETNAKKYVDINDYGNVKTFNNLAGINGGNSAAGAMVIHTPITLNNYMSRIDIKGYMYTGNTDIDVSVGFYAYSGGSFPNKSFISKGDYGVNKVRLAIDASGKVVIILEDTTSSWNYPKITVEKAQLGHISPPDSFKDGWSIAFETDISTYTNVATVPARQLETTAGSQAKVNTLKNSLGDVAYENLVEKAKLGTTVISGGYLVTALLEADSIGADKISVTSLDALSANLGTVTAGSILSNTSIDVTTSLYVGNNITLGKSNDTLLKEITFASGTASYTFGSSIIGDVTFLEVSSEEVALSGNILNLNSNKIVTSRSETGFMGLGGAGNGITGNAVLAGVNFRTKKTYTPSSISYTTTASNRTPAFFDISVDGFSVAIPGEGSSGFLYFRGNYTA